MVLATLIHLLSPVIKVLLYVVSDSHWAIALQLEGILLNLLVIYSLCRALVFGR